MAAPFTTLAPAGGGRFGQSVGVGEQHVGGGEGVEGEGGGKGGLAVLGLVQSGGVDEVVGQVLGQQVRLLEAEEAGVVLPGLGRPALVFGPRREGCGDLGIDCLGQGGRSHLQRSGRGLQQRDAHARWVGRRLDAGAHEGSGQMGRVEPVEDLVARPAGVEDIGLSGADRCCFHGLVHG